MYIFIDHLYVYSYTELYTWWKWLIYTHRHLCVFVYMYTYTKERMALECHLQEAELAVRDTWSSPILQSQCVLMGKAHSLWISDYLFNNQRSLTFSKVFSSVWLCCAWHGRIRGKGAMIFQIVLSPKVTSTTASGFPSSASVSHSQFWHTCGRISGKYRTAGFLWHKLLSQRTTQSDLE